MTRIAEIAGSVRAKMGGKLFRSKVREGWVALSFGAGTLSIAYVVRRFGQRPEVLMLRTESGPSADPANLKLLAKELGLNQSNCSLLLLPGEYQFLQIELPAVPAEEMKEAVRWSIKDMVDFPAETMMLDVVEVASPVERVGGVRQGFVAAADEGLIAERMGWFNDADARIEAIDIPEMAIRNIAALFEEPGRGLAMLMFDEERTSLTFTFNGELIAARQIDLPRTRLEQAEGEWRQQMFDRIALEVQRSLDNFERLHGQVSISKVLMTPLPMVTGLLEYLRGYLTLPVGELDLTEVLNITLVPELAQPGRQTFYLKLLGAALRE